MQLLGQDFGDAALVDPEFGGDDVVVVARPSHEPDSHSLLESQA